MQIVSVLSVSEFYLVAGYIYDSRQAKRIYGLLGAGAIAGSILGSVITDLWKKARVESMLIVCAMICAGLIVLAFVAWRHRRPDAASTGGGRTREETSDKTADLLRLVFSSRHLRLMILLVFFTMIASQITDWQLDKSLADTFQHLPKVEKVQEIKAYKARVNYMTNIVGIALQVTVASYVIRHVGIWASILFLPLGLFSTSLWVFIVPSLMTTAISLGGNSVFRYSIHKAGLELLFLPLSPDLRKKLKFFIDVFTDRVGRAVAAIIIGALTMEKLRFGLRGTAISVMLMACICIVIGIRLRKSYVDAFRMQLARREVDLSEVSRYVTDPASLKLLVSALESTQERQILYALGLLQSARGFDFSAQLLPLLTHPSAIVREEAARTLHALPGTYESEAERLFSDASAGVRLAAVEYLCTHDPAKSEDRLSSLLNHVNPDIRLAAARCAADQPDSVCRPSTAQVRNLMAIDGSRSFQAHEAAARLAARLPAPESVALLQEFLHDPRPGVAGAAAVGAGGAGRLDLVPEILPMLARRDLRAASRRALVSYGPPITAELGAVLSDEKRALLVRREVPWVLGRLQTAVAAEVLMENLNAEDFDLKYRVVKALSRIHARKPDLPEKKTLVTVHVIAQTMAYYEGLALCEALGRRKDDGQDGLLGKALRERLDVRLEMIFRLLGLSYPQKDIYFAYTALKGSRPQVRSSAIEFLDNVLKRNLKSIILPLLEEESAERLLARASRFFGVQVPGREEALRAILRQQDPWLKACALHSIGTDRVVELTDLCRQLAGDQDPLVRETADRTLQRLSLKNVDGVFHADHS